MPQQPANAPHISANPVPLASRRCAQFTGTVRVPGDKSISHRALIFAALANGTSQITGLLEAEDVLATAENLRKLGIYIARKDEAWIVQGRGVGGLLSPTEPLDFGNSGTGARLMMGVVAGHDFTATFTGDASLCSRPMGRIITPLREMGLRVLELEGDAEDAPDLAADAPLKLPLRLKGSADLIPLEYQLPVPSAQIKSAVLLAGLHAPGATTIIEPVLCRDHTENMLQYFGAKLEITKEDATGGRRITLQGEAELQSHNVVVPGDPSSAAFMAAAALIVPGGEVTIENLLINPSRIGFYTSLQEMGADITYENQRISGGEPVADLRIRHSALKGITVPAERAPSMIDEYPILAVVAAFAQGETRMLGLDELRVKECDRLAATYDGLRANGVNAEAGENDLTVIGNGKVAGGGVVTTHLDHRIAMAFLTMGLGSETPVQVDDSVMINTSFPQFKSLMQQLGAQIAPV